MTERFHLTVIAKQPVAGQVKTRLVPPLTPRQAVAVAGACLADTFAAVSALVSHAPDTRAVVLIDGEAGDWVPDGYAIHAQRGDGLAERLANGFDDLGPGLIIGMDTPSSGRWFDDAIAAIRAGDDAIGMTVDGGYWGIALATTEPAIFDRVEMSTTHTGRDQLAQMQRVGRSVRILPTVRDLDTFDDIAPLATELPGSHLATVATALLGPAAR